MNWDELKLVGKIPDRETVEAHRTRLESKYGKISEPDATSITELQDSDDCEEALLQLERWRISNLSNGDRTDEETQVRAQTANLTNRGFRPLINPDKLYGDKLYGEKH